VSNTTSTTRVAIIMAGGSGERFWPLSRQERPKQLLKLASADQTMLEEAVTRLLPLIPADHIYVQTTPGLVDPIRNAGLGIPGGNVLAEPCKRNTAGCLTYAAAAIMARYDAPPEALSMAIVTADHRIGAPDKFRACVEAAFDAAEADPVLVTMGIQPDRPATGYGYIQVESKPEESESEVRPWPVKAFQEKPALETAQQYVEDGRYFWNSGMFFWRVGPFLDELDAANPPFAQAARAIAEALRRGDGAAVTETFEGLESISIDYALMEKARRVAMIPAAFPWDDVGTWSALERAREKDAQGNVVQGGPVLIDAEDCIVYNAPGAERMAVSVVGMRGTVVVATEDGVLVIPKERSEEVKKAVEALRDRNAGQL